LAFHFLVIVEAFRECRWRLRFKQLWVRFDSISLVLYLGQFQFRELEELLQLWNLLRLYLKPIFVSLVLREVLEGLRYDMEKLWGDY